MTDERQRHENKGPGGDRAFEALIAPAREPHLTEPARTALKSRIMARIHEEATGQARDSEAPGTSTETDHGADVIAFPPAKEAPSARPSLPHAGRVAGWSGPAAALVAASLVLGIAIGATSLGDGVTSSIAAGSQQALTLAGLDSGETTSLFEGLMVDGAEDVF